MAGKEVYTNTIQNDQAIDISGLQSGIYIVKILSDSQNKAFKIVKQ
ncbi:MAG: T9SS type A sorting domain-containing protein [Flavobacterium stagni]